MITDVLRSSLIHVHILIEELGCLAEEHGKYSGNRVALTSLV
jgi:hypothetical protein